MINVNDYLPPKDEMEKIIFAEYKEDEIKCRHESLFEVK